MRHFSSVGLLFFWLLGCSATPVDLVIRGQLLAGSSSEPVADHVLVVRELKSARSAGGKGLLSYFLGTLVVVAETRTDENGQFEVEVKVRGAIEVGLGGCATSSYPLQLIDREDYQRQPEQWLILRIPEHLDCE